MKSFFGGLAVVLVLLGLAEASYEEGVAARAKGDSAEALNQWMVASDDPRCLTAIGAMYEYGEGFPKDDVKAAEWYRQAADKGEYRAIAQLAVFSLTGSGGVAKNPEEWRMELEKIEGKDSYADYILALFCANGYGGTKDLGKAQILLRGLTDKGYTQLEDTLRWTERRLADLSSGVFEAEALTAEIARNGASFDQSYKDRRIAVSGWAKTVERFGNDGYAVRLGSIAHSNALKDSVLAIFYDPSPENPLNSLKPGTFLKLNGVYVGKHPFPLEDCAFTLFGCSVLEVAEDPYP